MNSMIKNTSEQILNKSLYAANNIKNLINGYLVLFSYNHYRKVALIGFIYIHLSMILFNVLFSEYNTLVKLLLSLPYILSTIIGTTTICSSLSEQMLLDNCPVYLKSEKYPKTNVEKYAVNESFKYLFMENNYFIIKPFIITKPEIIIGKID